MNMEKKADVIIIGGGPAGAAAAVYTARAGFSTLVIYKDFGALEKAERVENYYGFTKIGGKPLVEKGLRQARASGAKTIKGEVVSVRPGGSVGAGQGCAFIVETAAESFEGKAVLLATGAHRAAPDIAGLAEYEGRGISRCALCDGFFYRGKHVAVLGSGAYALHEVRDLLGLASKVTLLTNGNEPSVSFPGTVTIRREKIREFAGGFEPLSSPVLAGISQKQKKLQKIIFDTAGNEFLPVSAVFIAIDTAGGVELAKKLGAALGPQGTVKTDPGMKTSVPGIWAAGDCTGGLKQIVKAAYEGARAGVDIAEFLRECE